MKWLLIQVIMILKTALIDLFTKLEKDSRIEKIKEDKEKLNELETRNSTIDSELDNLVSRHRDNQGSGDRDGKV